MEEMLHFDEDDLKIKQSIVEKSKENPDLKPIFSEDFFKTAIENEGETDE